jgi:hypothetical protein
MFLRLFPLAIIVGGFLSKKTFAIGKIVWLFDGAVPICYSSVNSEFFDILDSTTKQQRKGN